MTFAFATLAFLAAAWLAIVVLAGTLEEYGTKARAALSGAPPVPVAVVEPEGSSALPKPPCGQAAGTA